MGLPKIGFDSGVFNVGVFELIVIIGLQFVTTRLHVITIGHYGVIA